MAAAQDSQAAQDDLEGLVRRTFLVSGDKKDSNLEWVRDMLTDRAPDREAVLTTWRDVLQSRRVTDEEASVAKSHLKLTGVVRVVDGLLKPRNTIYTSAFDEAWVLQHLPQDLERQRRLKLYRRIAYISAAVALVLAGVGITMGVLLQRAKRAEAEARARQLAAQSEYLRPRPGQWSPAALLGLESVETLPLMEGRNAVAAALAAAPGRAALEDQAEVITVAISPDGRWLATASNDNTARVWDAATGKPVGAPLVHQGPVSALAISPDGRRLATASNDNTARVWEAATGKPVGAPLVHQGPVSALAISPDGRRLATASNDNTARVWETDSGRPVGAPLVHQGPVSALAISPDGEWLATASYDKTARIWDSATGQERARLDHQGPVRALAISPDAKWLATASEDKTARIWDAASGRPRARFELQYPVSVVAISPDGRWLATASEDNTARIWEAASGSEYLRLQFRDLPRAAIFTPDERLLAIAHGASTTLQPWRTEDLIHDLCARLPRNLTLAEWKQYLGNEPYRRTCPYLPGSEPANGATSK